MLNISDFEGGGEVELFFWKLELVCIHICYSFSEITIISYKEFDTNSDFSILLLIEIFLFFLNVKIIEKG